MSCMFAFWTWLAGAAAGFCCRVQLEGAAVRVLCALWSWLVGAAAGCRCRVLLWGAATKCCCQSAAWALELACRCRVLEGAAVRVLCALWSWLGGAVAGCRCLVLRALWSWLLQSAAAGSCVFFGAGLLVPLWGATAHAASGCCCQRAVCDLGV